MRGFNRAIRICYNMQIMLNQILFSIIGLIMLAIAGVGTVAVVKNPETAKEIIPEALTVVKDAVSDATTSITNLATSKRFSSDDDDNENEREDEDEDEDDNTPKGGVADGTGGTIGTTVGTTQTNPPPIATGGITMGEVAKHNSSASCYTAIEGAVYDLTSWINQHPGGSAAIKSLCGVDGTAVFNDQHGGQGKPEKTLTAYRIGALAQ